MNIRWEEGLMEAPTDMLAMLSLHLADKHYTEAIHIIKLYGTASILCESTEDAFSPTPSWTIPLQSDWEHVIDAINIIFQKRTAQLSQLH